MEGLTEDERREMAAWIDVHGAPKLKDKFAAGEDVEWDYLEARRAREFPGFFRVLSGHRLVWPEVTSMYAMEQEMIHEGAETMELHVTRKDEAGNAYDENQGEVIVISGWLGRFQLYTYVEYFP